MAVSLPVMVTLAGGEEAAVVSGPVVLTDVVVTEVTGGAPASVVLTGAEDGRTYLTLAVDAFGTAMWHGRFSMGSGISVGSQTGDVAVTVGYY